VQNSSTRQQATQLTLQLWAQQDPYAASAALDRLAAIEQSGLANSIAYEFVRLAPAQALEWAARHDGSYGSTWRYVMTELAKLDAETSFGLASGMPEEARSNALRIALGGMADSNPEMAAEYLIRVPEPDQRASIGQIVSRWSRLDADAARNWVMRLAPGDVRDQGLAELLRGDSVGHDTIIALLNAISGQQTRDSQAASAIRAAIRAESVADAEMLLSQVRLSPDTYSAMRAQIEAARN
jgi:hypothetical protein